jgi:uncharacterized protein YbbC (DUF1343 family)/CubicO group peptidase (beta-lactamase class C family)
VVLVGHRGKIVYRAAFGSRSLWPQPTPPRPDAIFDLASLTKVVATTTAVMQLVEQGRLRLDDAAATYWPAFAANGKRAITVRELLTHTSGLRPDPDHPARWSGKDAAFARLAAERPLRPPGTAFLYSDLNFIALGALVERVSGEPLDRYVRQHIFAKLGMADTGFRPARRKQFRIVPTDLEHGSLRWGAVQDPTAYAMGGVAGHAGLFSTADDLARFAQMLLNGGSLGGVRVLRPQTIDLMTFAVALPGGSRRGLGWDAASPYAAGLGTEFGPRSFGHTGYTGTALWIDPETGTFLILLASRLHPNGHGRVKDLRRRIAHLVAETFRPKVLPGIDVLEDQGFAPLLGRRIGLLTNRASRDLAGRRTIDVLAVAPGVKLAAIFTPEHGLGADREGRIESGTDETTGLPIRSLYGASLRPRDSMLVGLDALVVDLQDAGVRFFTYPTTVAYLLEAAARKGIDVYVLDRPDPIDAAIVEGPVLDPSLRSFTGYFPMPLRHGMTLGELAMMFNGENRIGARLTVIPMHGYRRESWYEDTGLPWVNPSPNLRSPAEAMLYAGIGLVEGADVSVGRGTATPFEWLGAPWINSAELVGFLASRRIEGVRFAPADFMPKTDRFAGQLCHGVRITVTDRARLDAARLGLELAAALHRLYPRQFRIEATTGMIGSRKIVTAIAAGADPRTLPATWQSELKAYQAVRDKYLLYR